MADAEETTQAKAARLCAAAGIDDLEDCGSFSFDGAPEALMDRGEDACENHLWFSHVWPWGRQTMVGEPVEVQPNNCLDKKKMGKMTAGEIRGMSGK